MAYQRTPRKTKHGYSVEVRHKEPGQPDVSKTVKGRTKKEANAAARKVVDEFNQRAASGLTVHGEKTVRAYLQWWLETNTKNYAAKGKIAKLKFLAKDENLDMLISDWNRTIMYEYCERRAQGDGYEQTASPSTIKTVMGYIHNCLQTAHDMTGAPYNETEYNVFYRNANKMGVIGNSKRRERRPTEEELNMISKFFKNKKGNHRSKIPYLDLVWMAIHTSWRQDEICQLRWADFDENSHQMILRNVKDPRKSDNDGIGPTVKVLVSPAAEEIILRQPRCSERIFPFSAKSISTTWLRFRKSNKSWGQGLEVEDLHWHDFRHEAISRFFEYGLSSNQVSQYTGHRTLQSLERYEQARLGVRRDKAELDHPRSLKLVKAS